MFPLLQLQSRHVPLRSLTFVLVSRGEGSAMQHAPLAGALRSAALEVPGLHVKVVPDWTHGGAGLIKLGYQGKS